MPSYDDCVRSMTQEGLPLGEAFFLGPGARQAIRTLVSSYKNADIEPKLFTVRERKGWFGITYTYGIMSWPVVRKVWTGTRGMAEENYRDEGHVLVTPDLDLFLPVRTSVFHRHGGPQVYAGHNVEFNESDVMESVWKQLKDTGITPVFSRDE